MLMCDLKNVVHAKPPTLIDISCSKKGRQMFVHLIKFDKAKIVLEFG